VTSAEYPAGLSKLDASMRHPTGRAQRFDPTCSKLDSNDTLIPCVKPAK
jgi:hypothetical protein